MRKPKNFDKIYNFDMYFDGLNHKLNECPDDPYEYPLRSRLWLVDSGYELPNLLLLTIHWDIETLEIRCVASGGGLQGQMLDTVEFSKSDLITHLDFIRFIRNSIKGYIHCLKD